MQLVHNLTGLLHLITSLLAVILGSMVLLMKKGTRRHRQIGYAYSTCMLAVIATAFGLYHLFGTFGPFHFAALVSFVTLIVGMIPAIRRRRADWLRRHIRSMYYSVMGLYAAFAAEVFVRIPGSPFITVVAGATVLTFIIGVFIFKKKSGRWLALHARRLENQKHH